MKTCQHRAGRAGETSITAMLRQERSGQAGQAGGEGEEEGIIFHFRDHHLNSRSGPLARSVRSLVRSRAKFRSTNFSIPARSVDRAAARSKTNSEKKGEENENENEEEEEEV